MYHPALRIHQRCLVGLLFAVVLVVPAGAKDHGIKFDRDADFSKYKVYDWVVESKPRPKGSPLSLGAAADTKIRDAIDRHLRDLGFEPAVDAEADFLVTYDGSLEPITDIEGQRRDLGKGVAWVIEGSITSYNRGTLVITIRDRESGREVWSGWTTATVSDPDHPDKQINRTVRKLLRRFPPRR